MSGCNESSPGPARQRCGGLDLWKVWVLPNLTPGGGGCAVDHTVWRQGLPFSLSWPCLLRGDTDACQAHDGGLWLCCAGRGYPIPQAELIPKHCRHLPPR